jgi:hypothetical protein
MAHDQEATGLAPLLLIQALVLVKAVRDGMLQHRNDPFNQAVMVEPVPPAHAALVTASGRTVNTFQDPPTRALSVSCSVYQMIP